MWRGSKNTQKLWWDFLLGVKRIDRGKSLWFAERELSTWWSYLILWPLLSKAISHTREAASVLSKTFRLYPIFLCSKQFWLQGQQLCLRTFPRATEDGSSCVSGSPEALLVGSAPVSLNQGCWSDLQIKGIDVSVSPLLLFSGGITLRHVFHIVSRIFS